MQDNEAESVQGESRKDSTKIYFFVVAIVALLATNVYFYVKYKSTDDKVYELTEEKVSMEAEIDRIEAEVDRLSEDNTELSASLESARDSVRTTISSLRAELAQSNLTREQLGKAQQEINQLKEQVAGYVNEVEQLRSSNARLASERDQLREEVSLSSDRLAELEAQQTDLVDMVRVASAIKVSNISINGVRQRGSNRESVETRARRVDRLRIDFTIADNPLAEIGNHDIYMRVIDPNGNLQTTDGYGLFEVDGKQMQYTYKTAIAFQNDGAAYTIDWSADRGFQKGTYTILLYADSAVMGQNSVVLR